MVERKKPGHVGSIAHVDHGKTALTAAVMRLLGDQRVGVSVPAQDAFIVPPPALPADHDSELTAAHQRIEELTRALEEAATALEVGSAQILASYRTWVADDIEAKPRYGQIPRYDIVNTAIGNARAILASKQGGER